MRTESDRGQAGVNLICVAQQASTQVWKLGNTSLLKKKGQEGQICITVTITWKRFFCYVKHQEDGLKEALSQPLGPNLGLVHQPGHWTRSSSGSSPTGQGGFTASIRSFGSRFLSFKSAF